MLYFLSLLHQTTTPAEQVCDHNGCISFLFYIKPQRWSESYAECSSCISFLFYIKPQLLSKTAIYLCVVFPFSSTSSHNFQHVDCPSHLVVFPFSSTSSHNSVFVQSQENVVVFPFSSTSSHNSSLCKKR